LPIIGSFGLKFFPNGFENSLTPSNPRPSNARSELFSGRKQNHSAAYLGARGGDTPDVHSEQSRSKISQRDLALQKNRCCDA